jgi:hypothetical protein
MAFRSYHALLLLAATVSLLGACAPAQTEPDAGQFANQVETSVASTLTAFPTLAPPANTPLPTPTEALPPSPTSTLPATVPPATASPTLPPAATPIVEPDYACDITSLWPADGAVLRPKEDFDIRWTIVNTGTQRWEHGTYLEYQSGPEMTEETRVDLPRLKPGEEFEVILDASAPDETDRQTMIWAVQGPGAAKGSFFLMCYPYVRIDVEE